MGDFCDRLEIGSMVVTGGKSVAADVIVKLNENTVIEFQCKSGIQRLTEPAIAAEVEKSMVCKCRSSGYRSIFVLVYASGVTVRN